MTFETWRQLFLWPRVRPWAMLTPVLVLLLATPMIASLWAWPVSGEASYWLAQGRHVAETGSLVRLPGEPSGASPVFGVLVGALVALLSRVWPGVAESDQSLHFFVTAALATIPTAIGGGLLYRIGRLFELRRGPRALLASSVVLASGWLGFAARLEPAALAIACLIGSWTCFLYFAAAKRPRRTLAVFLPAGSLLTLCGLLEPTLAPLAIGSGLAIISVSMRRSLRAVALALLVAGAIPLVLTQLAWTLSLPPAHTPAIDWTQLDDATGGWPVTSRLLRLFSLDGVFGAFPIALLGIASAWALFRRHWPAHAKFLAAATLVSVAIAITLVLLGVPGVEPKLLIAPLLLWIGQSLRHKHRVWLGVLVALIVTASIASSLRLALEPVRDQPKLTFAATSLR